MNQVQAAPTWRAELKHDRLPVGTPREMDPRKENDYTDPHSSLNDSALLTNDKRASRLAALDAAVSSHPVRMWGLKPACIGLLAVFAASPILVVFPLVAEAFDVTVSKTAVVVAACLVWVFGASTYVLARGSGVLDEHDRLPKRKTRSKSRGSLIGRMLGVEDEAVMRASAHEAVRDLLRQADSLIYEEKFEEALRLHRDAIRKAMRTFQRTDDYWLLYLGLYAYYGAAFCALLTGREKEAATAVETGIARARIGMERWPGVTKFVERETFFSVMKWKAGLEGAAYLPEDFSHWPFDN